MAPTQKSTKREVAGTKPIKPQSTSMKKQAKPRAKKEMDKSLAADESFTVEVREDGVYHIFNEDLEKEEHQEKACDVPRQFLESRVPGDENGVLPDGWMLAKGNRERHFEETKDGSFFTCGHISTEEVLQIEGLLPLLLEWQTISLKPGFPEKLRKFNGDKNESSAHFEMGFSVNQGDGNHAIGMSNIARGGPSSKKKRTQDPDVLRFNEVSTLIHTTAVEHIVPKETLDMARKNSIIDAAMTRTLDSLDTGAQLNHCSHEASDLEPLKKFGNIHTDQNDAKRLWTVFPNVSHLPEDYHPGHLLIPGLKLVMPFPVFSINVFQGGHAHVVRGLGPYPDSVGPDSPFRHKPVPGIPRPLHDRWRRIAVPIYSTKAMAAPKFIPRNEILSDEAIKCHWGSEERLKEWSVQFWIRQNENFRLGKPIEETPLGEGKGNPKCYKVVDGVKQELKLLLPKSYQDLSAEEIVKLFPWKDKVTGETRYPKVEIAQLCLDGHRDRCLDVDWDTAKKVTDECTFGFRVSKAVSAAKAKAKVENEKLVAPITEKWKLALAEYGKYEKLGYVKPVKESQTARDLGSNSVKRGKMPDDIAIAFNSLTLTREERKEVNRAVALGQELNEMEHQERKDRVCFPKKMKDLANYY